MPDGRLVHSNVMTGLVYRHGADRVRKFQYTQETSTRFVLRVILRASPAPERIAALEQDARTMLGPGTDFSVEIVDDLPLDPSGKFQVCRPLV